MLAVGLFSFDFSRWETWAALAGGLAAAGLVMMVGRVFLRPGRIFMRRFFHGRNHAPPRGERRLPAARGQDRRASPRRNGRLRSVLVSGGEDDGASCRGLLLDRSQGGLRLSLCDPVAVGTILTVRRTEAPMDAPEVRLEGIHCHANGQGWEIGGRFLEPPTKETRLCG